MTQKEKLEKKLSDLKIRLFNQQLKDHEKMARAGWGHGMRCVKSLEFKQTERLEARIEEIETSLKEYNC